MASLSDLFDDEMDELMEEARAFLYSSGETMTPAAFNHWLEAACLSELAASKALGCSRTSIRNWRRRGAPLYIALACSAILMRLPAYDISV